jgi:hypothetical protein
MTNGPATVKPKIDDQYWFNLSEKLTENAVSKRDEAAGKLQNLAVWLWGIYTASAAVGFALSGKALSLSSTLLIAGASASLIAVYWSTIWVQMPDLVNFDPRSPTDIQAAYATLVTAKHRRLNFTLGFSVLAAVLVSVALLVASVPDKVIALPNFEAVISTLSGKRTLSVTATIPDTDQVTVRVESVPNKPPSSFEYNGIFKIADKGLLQISIPLETEASAFKVITQWTTSSRTQFQISKLVESQLKPKDGKTSN